MSLKKNKKLSKLQKILIACLLIALVVCGGLFAYWQMNKNSNNSTDTPTESKNKDDASKKNIDEDSSTDSPSNEEPKTTPQYSDENGGNSGGSSSSTNVSVSISAIQSGSDVRVNTTINQIWSTGNCTLNITNGGSSTTKTAAIQAMPSYSTCQGFSIPVNELGTGDWKLNLTVTHDSQTITATQEVTVQ